MDVTCGTCHRKFQLDDARASSLNAAQCLCGARLLLNGLGATRTLGKYQLTRRIAVGGMGEIYHGKLSGIEGFEREVAIKKMLQHLSADRNFIDMIVKEAKLTVLLNHPNIVQVYDLAKEGDEYYLAMEYVPGINVGTLLETCRKSGTFLPVDVAIHITLNVLKGLHYAHDLRGPDGAPMGILHRDVTPQNILVTPEAWVKITDFGIAKARNEISTTSPGMIKGKLGYIAPEQLTGVPLDNRLDIFCAGIVFWESLACRRLFKGASEIDTFRLIAEAKVPPLGKIRDDVPEAVEEVIHTALARDRDQRFRTGQEFYDALAQAIFPKTPDDCLAACEAFFASHPHFFASLTPDEEIDGQPTVQMDVTGEAPLVSVQDLVAPPVQAQTSPSMEAAPPLAQARRSRWPAAAIFVLFVVVGAAAAYFLRERLPVAALARQEAAEPEAPQAEGLSQEEVDLGIASVRDKLVECYGRFGNRDFRRLDALSARLVIPSTGGVAKVDLEPPVDDKLRGCLEPVLRNLAYRPHQLPKLEVVAALPAPNDRPVGRATGAGEPSRSLRSLTSAEIQATIGRHSNAIVRCLQGLSGNVPDEVRPTIRIEPSGRVSEVTIKPPLQDAQAQSCLTRVLRGMRFRKHPDKNLAPITIPLKIKR